ncbi:hypothetical protein H0G86_001548 [Trichoderma simmonsii]|uniref:Uncharacterized protein n=1 Tax=Trichoderma simmonsii TaxID=1491479 RepID=A0A8G0L701_9HYPO|nr:hypothetical protein H0G86_001548 [Trichoderma simmonsii]
MYESPGRTLVRRYIDTTVRFLDSTQRGYSQAVSYLSTCPESWQREPVRLMETFCGISNILKSGAKFPVQSATKFGFDGLDSFLHARLNGRADSPVGGKKKGATTTPNPARN